MKILDRGKVAEIAKPIVEEYERRVDPLNEDAQMTWSAAHVFTATALKTSLLEDTQCADELKAFANLNPSGYERFFSIMAFWLYNYLQIIDDEPVRAVLSQVYRLEEAEIMRLKSEFSNRDDTFLILHKHLSSAINHDIAFTAFMPHVVNAYKHIASQ